MDFNVKTESIYCPIPPISQFYWELWVETHNVFEEKTVGYPCNKQCDGVYCKSGSYNSYDDINGCVRSSVGKNTRKSQKDRKTIFIGRL